ncbi:MULTISPECIES: hypothetical protein [unclassified Streptomyces]|uniref:hypothetical protein n=1 Tax=Streptomyces sp. NPDC127532 TaxID=3345399 RepID=UPI003627C2BD
MICPRCAASLKGKERAGRVCVRCRKRFALDPAVHGKGMHDLRVRGIAQRATDHGRLKITLTQLWYLSRSNNYAWAGRERKGVPARIRWLVALPVAVALLLSTVLVDGDLAFFAGAAAFLILAAASAMRHRPGVLPGSRIIPSEEMFRGLMTGAWPAAYGDLPAGVFDDARPLPRPRGAGPSRASAPVSRPRAVILCTDRVVSLFLTANDVPGELGAVLLEATGREGPAGHSALVAEALDRLAEYRSALPVVVLHDADPLGVLLTPLIRAAQPDRVVVDAGLPVSAARGGKGVVRLARPNRIADAEQLRTVAGLSEADARWLADGYWSPVAAVPPPLLLSIVERAVQRALTLPPPGPRQAHAHGFLTWPQAPQPPRARGTGRPGTGPSTKEGTSPA